jgi:hypothetical protein
MPPKMERPAGFAEFVLKMAKLPDQPARTAAYVAYAELVGVDVDIIRNFVRKGMPT